MFDRSWLLREIQHWFDEGIISKEQKEMLQARYQRPAWSSTKVILLFAGLLVGLGTILFIASNWDDLTRPVRLGLIIAWMLLFYAVGYDLAYGHRLTNGRRTYPLLGQGLLFVGVLSYGGGIWLIGQMYNLSSYDATGLGLWFLGAAGLAHLTGNHAFFFLAAALLTFANLSDIGEHTASFVTGFAFFPVYLATLVLYTYRHNQYGIRFVTTLCGLLVLVAMFNEQKLSLHWLGLLPLAGLIGEQWFARRKQTFLFSTPLLLVATFIIQLVQASEMPAWSSLSLTTTSVLALSWLLLSLAAWLGDRRRFTETAAYSLFCLPASTLWISVIHALSPDPATATMMPPELASLLAWADIISVILLAIASIILIQSGSYLRRALSINLGIAFFLISVLYAYGRFAWGLFDKSLFFIGGGLVLFVLGFYLESKRRHWIDETREVP
ncbi:DUF2157 domain-containing protein [Heliophilum fasciatum]|uniref:Putative membrane protein n=1 Tax=Heliophilum fasciatum TaxID=35700 RepID=A0A4R2RL68_9FIRM|nr:DUF2157 domain-containing protein [Heliophilum fasciatum]MCW2277846.1 putative membrane protein [Heliophilum fasciatum]TCP64662.1 putative membrane protein [Heliophilum fasciatum]